MPFTIYWCIKHAFPLNTSLCCGLSAQIEMDGEQSRARIGRERGGGREGKAEKESLEQREREEGESERGRGREMWGGGAYNTYNVTLLVFNKKKEPC